MQTIRQSGDALLTVARGDCLASGRSGPDGLLPRLLLDEEVGFAPLTEGVGKLARVFGEALREPKERTDVTDAARREEAPSALATPQLTPGMLARSALRASLRNFGTRSRMKTGRWFPR